MSDTVHSLWLVGITLGGLALILASIIPSRDFLGPSPWQRCARCVAILVVMCAVFVDIEPPADGFTMCGGVAD